ncbi:MAG: DUF642 domain-containing protein [Gemmatimonadaceae bacterium]
MTSVRRNLFALAASAVMLTPLTAFAQVVNPGFETPAMAAGTFVTYVGGNNLGGWTVVGNQASQVSTTYTETNGVNNATLLFNAHSGLVSLDLTGNGNTGITNGVQQSLATVLGQNYMLSFWVGRATGNTFYGVASTVDLSINGGSRVSFTNSNSTNNQINWQLFSFGFTATTTSTQVTFFNGTASTGNNYVGLDDVSISGPASTVAPEPSSVLLVAAGLAGLGVVARRRKGRKTA